MRRVLSIALLSSLTYLGACQNTNGTAQNNSTKETISVDQFEKKVAETPNAQLVDVRTAEEYADRHLKNAVNMDVKKDDCREQFSALDKLKPVFVYCLSGGRSSTAAGIMQEMGFKEIYNMEGGIMKWEHSGKPVEQGKISSTSTGISMADFNKQVSQKSYVLVDYNAPWCEPCKKMLPFLESLAQKKSEKLVLLKINADDNKVLLKEKGISSIPYLELFHDGKLVWKHNGYIEEKQLLEETRL
jgi:thioredoxin 1